MVLQLFKVHNRGNTAGFNLGLMVLELISASID